MPVLGEAEPGVLEPRASAFKPQNFRFSLPLLFKGGGEISLLCSKVAESFGTKPFLIHDFDFPKHRHL